MMKLKYVFVLLLLLALPEMASAYYVWRPCCFSCNRLAGWWASADYMLMWRKERFYPALVTSNPVGDPVLGDPATRILFGDEKLSGCPKSGVRADGGLWWNRSFGFGGGFFLIGNEGHRFNFHGNNDSPPFLGRPFFNEVDGQQDAELFSALFGMIITHGEIEIDTTNRMWGADAYACYRLYRSCHYKWDLLGGFYYNQLVDNLDISTRRREFILLPDFHETRHVHDKFNCTNNFYGGLLGVKTEMRGKSWALAITGKAGIGYMQQRTKISGSETIIDEAADTVEIRPAGLLAQPSNIGRHHHNKFEVIPEFSVNLQYKVWCNAWFTAGYTCIYWPLVVLAGEQVDLRVNRSQFPGPTMGPLAPLFPNREKSFWTQGVTAGFYIFF